MTVPDPIYGGSTVLGIVLEVSSLLDKKQFVLSSNLAPKPKRVSVESYVTGRKN